MRRVAADAKVKDEKPKCAARRLWLRRRPRPSQLELNGSRVAAEGELDALNRQLMKTEIVKSDYYELSHRAALEDLT
jgi:hypothetical protein